MPDGLDGRPRVLVVDDEKAIREMLAEFLGMEGYAVRTAEDGLAAVNQLQREEFDLVISDLKMPRMGGIALLEEIGKAAPSTVTVIMTGFGTVETAIDAMKRGAYDYVLKPFKLDEVVHVLNRGLEKQRMAAENMRLREAVSLYKVSEAIAASLNLDQVLETVADSSIHELSADMASTWLDDGEGGFFERQHLLGRDAPKGVDLGQIDPETVLAHLRTENQLLEQGPAGAKYFSKPPAAPLVSFLAVPLRLSSGGSPTQPPREARLVGFLASCSFSPNKRFDEGQRKLASLIASRAAAAIENARLYEDLQATFQQTIQGLAKAIDKMDRYTSGHSDRVARYAVILAKTLGLSPDQIEIVRQSALMHDIGKIGCV
ncbi:MAG: response regulator, partial [Myxococcales bacterium]|nr:response regulator [Myxococcales bacterium]